MKDTKDALISSSGLEVIGCGNFSVIRQQF